MRSTRASRRWLPLAGAIVAITLIACGGDDSVGTDPGSGTSTTTTAAASGSDGASGATADAAGLSEAVAGVGTRYAFTATVTLDGAEVTRVIGTVYDGVGAYEVVSGGATIEYVASNDGQWARQADGEWTTLAEAAPLIDPLDALARPLEARLLESAGTNALVEAVYDGTALGFSSGDEVVATITITDGVVSSISYDVEVGNGVATVITAFDGTADVSPIQVPPT